MFCVCRVTRKVVTYICKKNTVRKACLVYITYPAIASLSFINHKIYRHEYFNELAPSKDTKKQWEMKQD